MMSAITGSSGVVMRAPVTENDASIGGARRSGNHVLAEMLGAVMAPGPRLWQGTVAVPRMMTKRGPGCLRPQAPDDGEQPWSIMPELTCLWNCRAFAWSMPRARLSRKRRTAAIRSAWSRFFEASVLRSSALGLRPGHCRSGYMLG